VSEPDFSNLTLEDASAVHSNRVGAALRPMKELLKIAVCVVLAAVLAPVAGFWVVALVGAALFLLPAGMVFSTMFPKAWKHIEDELLAKTSSLSPS
jgi:hypothetical protein